MNKQFGTESVPEPWLALRYQAPPTLPGASLVLGLVLGTCDMCESAPKLNVREFRFGRDQKEEDRDEPRPELMILISEVLDPQFGLYVWPCAVVLAQYIWFHRGLICGKRILEIGAGTSLPGIVAAKCGAEVTLSDNAVFPECLINCQRSCQMNNLSGVYVTGLTWGHISPSLLALAPLDLILASDVFFEPEVPIGLSKDYYTNGRWKAHVCHCSHLKPTRNNLQVLLFQGGTQFKCWLSVKK